MTDQLHSTLATALEQLAELVARRLAELQQDERPDAEERSPWMGIDAAAAYLDWPKQRLYKLTAQSAIPHYKHDGRLLFHRPELDRWLAELAQPARRLARPPNESY